MSGNGVKFTAEETLSKTQGRLGHLATGRSMAMLPKEEHFNIDKRLYYRIQVRKEEHDKPPFCSRVANRRDGKLAQSLKDSLAEQ